MHYPWWYVPYLTAPMLIAVVAVLHVLVSHYAVGGGLFLAVEVGHAYRTRDRNYLEYLHRHAAFFILVTVVFGAISGVGIWWTIGLTSPLATEVLIRTFVFGWATEWVFFVVEIVAAFLFYYYWGRLSEKTHVIIGWIYAAAAWISLVLITGITAFMVNPGVWAMTDGEIPGFLDGLLQSAVLAPDHRPHRRRPVAQLALRLPARLVEHPRRPAAGHDRRAVGAAGPAGGHLDYRRRHRLVLLPSRLGQGGAQLGGRLERAGGPDLRVDHRGVLPLVFRALPQSGLAFARLRRFALPVRHRGLQHAASSSARRCGSRSWSTTWCWGTRCFPKRCPSCAPPAICRAACGPGPMWPEHYPQTIVNGRIDGGKLLRLPHADRVALGEVLFQHHCNDCHAATEGYSAAGALLHGRSRELVHVIVEHLEAVYFMPPWCGTSEEAELMTDYLMSINPPRPAGMDVGMSIRVGME